jgi:DNA topoisomerase-1
MEEKLDLIAEGKYTYLEMMTSFYDLFKKQLAQAQNDTVKATKFKCNLCSRPMILKNSKYGSFLGCSGYNDKENKCNRIMNCEVIGDEIKIVEKVESKVELVEGVLCPLCSAGMVLKDGKFGQFYGCSKYKDGCKGLSKIPIDRVCPTCGKNLTITTFKDGNKVYSCLGWPKCNFKENIPGGPKKFFKKAWKKK